MASRGKKKTTAAKLNREGKLRQKRADKAMRKTQRLADAEQRRDDEANGIFRDEDGEELTSELSDELSAVSSEERSPN